MRPPTQEETDALAENGVTYQDVIDKLDRAGEKILADHVVKAKINRVKKFTFAEVKEATDKIPVEEPVYDPDAVP